MAEEITKNLPDGVNKWFAAPAAEDATPDIILSNNGTLRIYTKNKVFAQNLVIQANVTDLGREFTNAKGPVTSAKDGSVIVPSVDQINESNRLDWFITTGNATCKDGLFEIIIAEGTKKVLNYQKVVNQKAENS